MNEKDMIEWARKKSGEESELSIDDARAQLTEEEESARRETIAKMQHLGIADPQIAADEVQAEKDEKVRVIEAKRLAAEDAAKVRDEARDADDLDAINEWRLEDDVPTIGALSEAAVDELEAACAGNPRLLIRRKRRLT